MQDDFNREKKYITKHHGKNKQTRKQTNKNNATGRTLTGINFFIILIMGLLSPQVPNESCQ